MIDEDEQRREAGCFGIECEVKVKGSKDFALCGQGVTPDNAL
jgi:hypothetical protein